MYSGELSPPGSFCVADEFATADPTEATLPVTFLLVRGFPPAPPPALAGGSTAGPGQGEPH